MTQRDWKKDFIDDLTSEMRCQCFCMGDCQVEPFVCPMATNLDELIAMTRAKRIESVFKYFQTNPFVDPAVLEERKAVTLDEAMAAAEGFDIVFMTPKGYQSPIEIKAGDVIKGEMPGEDITVHSIRDGQVQYSSSFIMTLDALYMPTAKFKKWVMGAPDLSSPGKGDVLYWQEAARGSNVKFMNMNTEGFRMTFAGKPSLGEHADGEADYSPEPTWRHTYINSKTNYQAWIMPRDPVKVEIKEVYKTALDGMFYAADQNITLRNIVIGPKKPYATNPIFAHGDQDTPPEPHITEDVEYIGDKGYAHFAKRPVTPGKHDDWMIWYDRQRDIMSILCSCGEWAAKLTTFDTVPETATKHRTALEAAQVKHANGGNDAIYRRAEKALRWMNENGQSMEGDLDPPGTWNRNYRAALAKFNVRLTTEKPAGDPIIAMPQCGDVDGWPRLSYYIDGEPS